jgi:hypothetical protein
MNNVEQLLNNLNINTTSRSTVGAGVREYIEQASEEKRLEAATMFFYDIFGMRPAVTDAITARLAAQYAVDQISKNYYEFGNAPMILEEAMAKAERYKADPNNAWQFATGASESSFKTSSDAPVTPKKNKGTAATELYNIHVRDAATPLDNGQFVLLLVKELEMTKSGARTYAYNCFKAGKEVK